MMCYGFHHGFGGVGLGWIFNLIILVLVIWLIVRIATRYNPRKMQSNNTPLDILKERYAKGEINKEEFDQKKKDLE